jgi:hypothetical protein
MTLQQRIEASAAGRIAISALVVAVLAAIAIGSVPESGLRSGLARHAVPTLNAVGLDQRWDLFAPEPRRSSIDLVAHITLADGNTESWSPPRRDALLGAYSAYRWRKLAERTIVRGGDAALARSLVDWIARERPGARYVQLVARTARLPAPGEGGGGAAAYVERTLIAKAPRAIDER